MGRWLACDPRAKDYVPIAPYVFSLNSPIKLKDSDGKVVVDDNGNEVKISMSMAKDGTISANFHFAKGTSEKVINSFNQNAGKAINSAIKVEKGQDLILKAVESKDNIHITISSKTVKGENDDGTTSYTLGATTPNGIKSVYDDATGKGKYAESQNIEVTLYEGSLNEVFEKGGTEGIKNNKLTKLQKLGATLVHELFHATSPQDKSKMLEGEQLTDKEHQGAKQAGTEAEQQYGEQNKKKKE